MFSWVLWAVLASCQSWGGVGGTPVSSWLVRSTGGPELEMASGVGAVWQAVPFNLWGSDADSGLKVSESKCGPAVVEDCWRVGESENVVSHTGHWDLFRASGVASRFWDMSQVQIHHTCASWFCNLRARQPLIYFFACWTRALLLNSSSYEDPSCLETLESSTSDPSEIVIFFLVFR